MNKLTPLVLSLSAAGIFCSTAGHAQQMSDQQMQAQANAWAGVSSGQGDQFASAGTGEQGTINQPTGEGVNAFGPSASGNGRTIPGIEKQSTPQQMVNNPQAQPNSVSNQILRPGAYSSPNAQGNLQMIPTYNGQISGAMNSFPSGQYSFGFSGGAPSMAGMRWGLLPPTSTSSVDLNIVDQ